MPTFAGVETHAHILARIEGDAVAEDWAAINIKFEAVKQEFDRIVEFILERKAKE